jgi:hypothetical protein
MAYLYGKVNIISVVDNPGTVALIPERWRGTYISLTDFNRAYRAGRPTSKRVTSCLTL